MRPLPAWVQPASSGTMADQRLPSVPHGMHTTLSMSTAIPLHSQYQVPISADACPCLSAAAHGPAIAAAASSPSLQDTRILSSAHCRAPQAGQIGPQDGLLIAACEVLDSRAMRNGCTNAASAQTQFWAGPCVRESRLMLNSHTLSLSQLCLPFLCPLLSVQHVCPSLLSSAAFMGANSTIRPCCCRLAAQAALSAMMLADSRA